MHFQLLQSLQKSCTASSYIWVRHLGDLMQDANLSQIFELENVITIYKGYLVLKSGGSTYGSNNAIRGMDSTLQSELVLTREIKIDFQYIPRNRYQKIENRTSQIKNFLSISTFIR